MKSYTERLFRVTRTHFNLRADAQKLQQEILNHLL